MHPETRGGWAAFVFIELSRLGVPDPCVLWGNPDEIWATKSGNLGNLGNLEIWVKSGDRRDIPHFSFYAAKVKLSCWASGAGTPSLLA
jgi:hypothetical protein